MSELPELVTVFRSADPTAADDAAAVLDLLADAGLSPSLLNDSAPGVPEGVWEVRVPPEEEQGALEALASVEESQPEGDSSHAMDLVEIFEGVGTTGELDAMAIRAVLDANHIPSVLVGAPQIPNLPFSVRVPSSLEEMAYSVLAAAEQAGQEQAAAEAEAAAETSN